MFYLVFIAIIACLFSAAVPIPGTDVWYSQFVSLLLFGNLALAIYFSKMSKAIGILFAYFTFSTIFISKQDPMALMCLMQVAFCLFIAKNIAEFSEEQRTKIWYVLGGLLVFQVLWGILQHFNLDPIFKLSTDQNLCDTVGFNGSHNQYGLFLAATSPAVFMFPILLPLVFIGLVLSKTFTAILGAICASLFFFHKKINKFLLIGIVSIGIIIFFSSTNKNLIGKFSERTALWNLSISQVFQGKAVMTANDNPNVNKIVTCNPFFGFGFQKFFSISPYTQRWSVKNRPVNVFEHAHNDYVEALFDLGVIGFLLVLYAIGELIFLYWASYTRTVNFKLAACGLIAFAISAMGIYTVHTAYNGFLFCVLLGLFYGEVSYGKKGRQQRTSCLVYQEGQEALRCN